MCVRVRLEPFRCDMCVFSVVTFSDVFLVLACHLSNLLWICINVVTVMR